MSSGKSFSATGPAARAGVPAAAAASPASASTSATATAALAAGAALAAAAAAAALAAPTVAAGDDFTRAIVRCGGLVWWRWSESAGVPWPGQAHGKGRRMHLLATGSGFVASDYQTFSPSVLSGAEGLRLSRRLAGLWPAGRRWRVEEKGSSTDYSCSSDPRTTERQRAEWATKQSQ